MSANRRTLTILSLCVISCGGQPKAALVPKPEKHEWLSASPAQQAAAPGNGFDKDCGVIPAPDTVEGAGDGPFVSTVIGDRLYVVLGPDGTSMGKPPLTPETSSIDLLIYRPALAGAYRITVSGCNTPAELNVYGAREPPVVRNPVVPPPPPRLIPQRYPIGKCAGGTDIAVTVTPSIKCSSNATEQTVFQTAKVYRLGLSVGGSFYAAREPDVGVDIGAGGEPNRAFERDKRIGIRPATFIQLFPFGFVPVQPIEDQWYRRLFVGTALPTDDLASSLNVLLGLEPVSGLQLHLGIEICAKQRHLGVGLANGDVFADDSSVLPKVTSWDCEARFFFGAGATLELVKKLL